MPSYSNEFSVPLEFIVNSTLILDLNITLAVHTGLAFPVPLCLSPCHLVSDFQGYVLTPLKVKIFCWLHLPMQPTSSFYSQLKLSPLNYFGRTIYDSCFKMNLKDLRDHFVCYKSLVSSKQVFYLTKDKLSSVGPFSLL
jgi:hypothetical protein